MFFDIHSHILPYIDDGATCAKESIELLEIMKADGITDVIATPHFYPQDDNLLDFQKQVKLSSSVLNERIKNKKLPNIYLGCELLYYSGISDSDLLSNFCLNGSKYLLLELPDFNLTEKLKEDLISLKEDKGIIPIIAHIERYFKYKNFNNFLKFVKSNGILTQVNASSILMPYYKKVIKKLIKYDILTFIATDTHSVDKRPPKMKEALKNIKTAYGDEVCEKINQNTQKLFNEIVHGESNEE